MTDMATLAPCYDEECDGDVAAETRAPAPLFDRIAQILRANRLEPTPTNYALAHRYLTAQDKAFNALVDQAIQSGGLNGASAAAIIAQRAVELSVADLQIIVAEAEARVTEMAAIVTSSGDATRAYGDALRCNAADLAAGEAPGTVVDSLIGVTQTMITRTRSVEEQLQTAAREIRQLRDSLNEAQEAANCDALTGLPNRRALDARLALARESARRTGRPFAIAICDIDHFKQFNDRFGHQIGDEVIKFVAASLAGKDGARLFAARYGGEEFVVLFEGMDAEEAAIEVDRIRNAVGARDLKVNATGQALGRLTFSAGVAQLRDEEDCTSAMLKRADMALYRAKGRGRDRVVLG